MQKGRGYTVKISLVVPVDVVAASEVEAFDKAVGELLRRGYKIHESEIGFRQHSITERVQKHECRAALARKGAR
jgi:hypothetical protein